MPKERSYVELSDLPLESMTGPIPLSRIMSVTKFSPIREEDKRAVVVIKEAFVLVDPRNNRVGVFTRSDKDHASKIGQCSALLCGNFDRQECTVTTDGTIIYDVKDRLHNYMREVSGLFTESREKNIPTVFFHDKQRDKRYLFLLFELTCKSEEMPLCCGLENRTEDMFIGMRDATDIKRGVEKYNRTSFEIDKAIIAAAAKRKRRFAIGGGVTFSIVDKIVDAKLASFTLIKINLIGV